MTIYDELIMRVSEGESFRISLQERSLKIGGKPVIKNGNYDIEKILCDDNITSMPDILGIIDKLYKIYKYSLPSKKSETCRRHYFKALPFDALSDEDLMVAERREVAQAMLEGFILCKVIDGSFMWDEPTMGKWFYQSQTDPDLIILKSWIEN